MDPTPTRSYDGWIGVDAYDSAGQKVGTIRDIFYDDVTGRPEFLAVSTGLLGTRNSLVPIGGSQVFEGEGHGLQLPFTKDQVKDAPNIDTDSALTEAEEQQLYAHYGYDWSNRQAGSYGYGDNYGTVNRADVGYEVTPQEAVIETPQAGEVVAEETVINEAVVKEQIPRTVRLRKYRWTEMVPVEHEEVRVEGDVAGIAENAVVVEEGEGVIAERPVR